MPRDPSGKLFKRDFAGEMLTFENGSDGRTVADLGGHFEGAERRGKTAGAIPEPILGRRDRVVADKDAVIHDHQSMLHRLNEAAQTIQFGPDQNSAVHNLLRFRHRRSGLSRRLSGHL